MNLDEGLHRLVLIKGDRLHYRKECINTLQNNTNLVKESFNSVLLEDRGVL